MKQNGKSLPAKTGPAAVDELRERRAGARPGAPTSRPAASSADRADLDEGREVVARREQQPDRQHARDEAVADERERERALVEIEAARAASALSSTKRPPTTASSTSATPIRLASSTRPGPDAHHVDAHARARSGSSRATVEVAHGLPNIAFTTTSAEHADQDDHDREHADQRRRAADRADLLAHHLAEALAVAAHRADQDREVLHRAAEHDADQDVERAGQVAELRREDRARRAARARRSPRSDGRRRPSGWSARSPCRRRGGARACARVVEREARARRGTPSRSGSRSRRCRAPRPGTRRSRASRRARVAITPSAPAPAQRDRDPADPRASFDMLGIVLSARKGDGCDADFSRWS